MRDGKFVILCVDDDPDLLLTTRTILEANGFLMEEARSAEEGLEVFKAVRPDLVLVDLMMEEVDAGKNLVKEIKLIDRDVPVLMLSSVGNSLSQSVDYQELGLSGVLQKPLDPPSFLSLLRAKLGKKGE